MRTSLCRYKALIRTQLKTKYHFFPVLWGQWSCRRGGFGWGLLLSEVASGHHLLIRSVLFFCQESTFLIRNLCKMCACPLTAWYLLWPWLRRKGSCLRCFVNSAFVHSFVPWSRSTHRDLQVNTVLETQFNSRVLKHPCRSGRLRIFVKSFFHSDFPIIWVICGWIKTYWEMSATTVTVHQKGRGALSYSLCSVVLLVMKSDWFLQLSAEGETCTVCSETQQLRPGCRRALMLHPVLWPLLSWFTLRRVSFAVWNCRGGRLALQYVHQSSLSWWQVCASVAVLPFVQFYIAAFDLCDSTVCADAPECGANSSGSLLLQITTGLKGHRGFDQLRLGQKQSHMEVILSIAFTFQRTGREERNLRAAEKLREKCSKQTAILHLKRTVMNT